MNGKTTGVALSFRKDKFFRARDSYAEWWKICCAQCGNGVLLYQKDGHGKLFRCYLNRIFAPTKYAELEGNEIMTKKKMPRLECQKCHTLLGMPMLHWEGRLAYRLIPGKWFRHKLYEKAAKEFKESLG
jgi:hypothetical protein